MSNEREMTLSLRIKANVAEARKNFAAFAKDFESVKSGASRAGSIISGSLNVALAPLKIMGGAFMIAEAAVAGFGMASIHAAAGNEQLRLRLQAVIGTAYGAQVAMKGISELAKHGFDKTDLVDAKIELLNLGIAGDKALTIMASAAGVVNMSVSEATMALAGMNARSLRRMGVDVEQAGDGMVLSFRDKSGQLHKIAAADATKARVALLRILNFKFGMGLELKEGSFEGIMAGLKASFKSVFGKVGEQLLPGAKMFMAAIRDGVKKIADSDELKQWATTVGAGLQKAATVFTAILNLTPKWIGDFKTMFKKNPRMIGTVITEAFFSGGKILMTAIIESWKATAGIFAGVGKIIGAAFMEEILPMLPGALQKKFANAGVDNASQDELRAMKEGSKTLRDMPTGGQGIREWMHSAVNNGWAKDDDLSGLAGMGRSELLRSGISQAYNAIPDAMNNIGSVASGEGSRLNAIIAGFGGPDMAEETNAEVKRIEAERSRVAPGGAERFGVDMGWNNQQRSFMSTHGGRQSLGMAPMESGRSVIINIQNANFQANSARDAQNSVLNFTNRIIPQGSGT